MITRTDVVAQLERGLRTQFLKAGRTYTSIRDPFVRTAPSDGAFELYGDMGATPWPRQATGQSGSGGSDGRTGAPVVGGLHEGGPIVVLGGNERSLQVYNRGWDIPIAIYHDAINDNRVGGLEEWARMAGARFEQHKDYLAFDALNNGEAVTKYGAGYDKLSFFNDAHIDPGAQYVTGQDNKYALALSLDNFETVRVAGSKFKDDRGQPCGFSHDLLIIPTDLERTAAQITLNREAHDTANREMNPYAGRIRALTAPGGWLDTTAWFVVAADMPQKPLILQERQAPILVFWDDHTQGGGIRYYKWYARYEIAYGDWRSALQGNT
jgi:phage major head subunit gpT-like protein